MVRFGVYDHDVGSGDDFIGQFSLPFISINQGMWKLHKISQAAAGDVFASLFPDLLTNH